MRLLSLNLWNLNEPLAGRLAELDAHIAANQYDAIFLQEVSPIQDTGRLQIGSVASLETYGLSYAQTGTWLGRAEGLAILTRYAILSSVSVRLPGKESDMDRGLLCVRVSDGARTYHLLNTHLAFREYDWELRIAQARSIVEQLEVIRSSYPSDRLILCGDLNDTPESAPVRALESEGRLVSAFRGSSQLRDTFSSENPLVDPALGANRRIDHVYCSADCRVRDARVVLDDVSAPVSDHYGLAVEMD